MSTKLEKIGNHTHTLVSNSRVSLPSRRRITLGVFSIADVRCFVPDIVSADSYVSTSYFCSLFILLWQTINTAEKITIIFITNKKSLLLNFKKLEGNNIFETLYVVEKWLLILASEELLFPKAIKLL